jgi:hypothetical protein
LEAHHTHRRFDTTELRLRPRVTVQHRWPAQPPAGVRVGGDRVTAQVGVGAAAHRRHCPAATGMRSCICPLSTTASTVVLASLRAAPAAEATARIQSSGLCSTSPAAPYCVPPAYAAPPAAWLGGQSGKLGFDGKAATSKAEPRQQQLDIEVSAGWVSSSSRGMCVGDAPRRVLPRASWNDETLTAGRTFAQHGTVSTHHTRLEFRRAHIQ